MVWMVRDLDDKDCSAVMVDDFGLNCETHAIQARRRSETHPESKSREDKNQHEQQTTARQRRA